MVRRISTHDEVVETNFDKFCSQTSCHGFHDLLSSKRHFTLRILWVFLIIVAMVFAIYEMGMVFINWQSSPVITTYSFESNDSLRMPFVQICPTNIVNKTKVEMRKIPPPLVNFVLSNRWDRELSMMMVNPKLSDLSDSMIDNTLMIIFLVQHDREMAWNAISIWHSEVDDSRVNYTKTFFKTEALLQELHNTTTEDVFALNWKVVEPYYHVSKYSLDINYFFSELGLDVDEIFHGCTFAGKHFKCSDHITPMFDQVDTSCFGLRYTEDQFLAGLGFGLMIDLHSDVDWTEWVTPTRGITVKMADSYNPRTVDGLKVRPGVGAHISMHAEHYNLQESQKYGRCAYDVERTMVTYPYSDDTCRIDCYLHALKDKCDCTPLQSKDYLVNPDEYKMCIGYDDLECTRSFSMNSSEAFRTCITKCRSQCDFWKYNPVISYNEFLPSNWVVMVDSYVGDHLGLDEQAALRVRRDAINLMISYDSMHFVKITESESLSIDGFIAQIGGQLGLMLGASLLSIVQAIILTAQYYCCGGDEEKIMHVEKTRKLEKHEQNTNLSTMRVKK